MSFLTDAIELTIRENPHQSYKWYADKIGCSQNLVIKVIRGDKTKRLKMQISQYSAWSQKVQMLIVLSDRATEGWQDWRDWEQDFKDGLTPMQAFKKSFNLGDGHAN